MNDSLCPAARALVCATLAVLFCHAAIGVERAMAEPVRIALIGDSTVASYDKPPVDRPTLTGWGQVFGEFFDDSVEIYNFALSGRSSKSFLREGHWPKPLAAEPDYVFIQFGHNDEPGKGDRSTDPAGDYQDNLRRYIDEARAAGAVPVLVTPVARRTFESGKLVTTLAPYASAMKQVGREKQTPVIDLHRLSLAFFARVGDEGGADLSPAPNDRSHFSRKGARAVAGLVANALPRAVPALIPRLKEHVFLTAGGDSDDLPGFIRLVLPPTIDAVVGQEVNVYFENVALMLNADNYTFDVECGKGRQQQERWTFTPQPDDLGEHGFRLVVRDEQNRLLASGKSTARVVAADAGDGRQVSLLLIGDSLTHASVYPERLLTLAEKLGGPQLTLIGSHGPGGAPGRVRHEGYGGWTAQRFATHYTGVARQGDYRQRGSPFLYPDAEGKPKLDFSAYCRDVNGGTPPDLVAIFLGPNDVFSLNDETIEAGIRTMIEHYDLLLGMVRTAAPQTRIGVMLPVPPAMSQDAFGANYSSGQTRWQYRRNQHRLVERMIDHYGGREQDGIELVPTYVTLDCRRNYPVERQTASANDGVQRTRQNNGVHPDVAGYHQIGDSLFAWLKARMASTSNKFGENP
jgi:lysophospholipase L1-like esterase